MRLGATLRLASAVSTGLFLVWLAFLLYWRLPGSAVARELGLLVYWCYASSRVLIEARAS